MKVNTKNIRASYRLKRLTCLALTFAMIFALLPQLPVAVEEVQAENPTPFPWSARANATLDYIDDVYEGITGDSVFEDVTVERLLDILSSEGNYYIIFGGPQNESTQKIIGDIGRVAETEGITKIYHFNPFVDGYQLDITETDGVGLWSGGTKGGTGTSATPQQKLHDIWTEIIALLPPGVSTEISDYDSDDTILFHFQKDNKTDLPSETTVPNVYTFEQTSIATHSDGDDDTAIEAVFTENSSERSDYAFFKRIYNGNATYFNLNSGNGETGNRTGKAEQLISDTDFGADGNGFRLHQVTSQELFNILNAPGEHAILFASAPCHNTQAVFGEVAKRAKTAGYGKTVYVYDPSIGGATVFGEGENIDKVLVSSATGGLYTRNSNYNFSYIYANIANYFGNFITENNTKQNNRIHYRPDGDINQALTTAEPWSSEALKGAIRLQVPFLLSYDNSKASPVTKQWIHKKNGQNTYSEYMLDLSFVRGTKLASELAVEASRAGNDSVDTDGLQAVEFAQEAIKALDNVLNPGQNTPVIFSFNNKPAPTIKGTAQVGETLSVATGPLSQAPDVEYQWYVGGEAVSGAKTDKYLIKSSDSGKKIKVSVTVSRTGYHSISVQSNETSAIVPANATKTKLNTFKKAPKPKIKGNLKVGKKLTVNVGKWNPKPSKFKYQWYANGKKIKGATKASLKLKKAQKGKKITVRVTSTLKNYKQKVVISKPSKKVK